MIIIKNISLGLMLGSLLLFSCGKGDEKDNNTDKQDLLQLSPSEQISAEWSGIYRNLTSNGPDSEALAASAKFSEDGQFEIFLEQDRNAKVIGTWSEFQGKTLIFKITGSTLSSIGSAGKIVEANFEIIGENLRIYSQNFDLRLLRKVVSNPSENRPGGIAHFFQATWACNDGNGRKTMISIDEKWHFKLISVRANERAFVAEGEVGGISDEQARLQIASSSDPVAANSFFELRRSSSLTLLTLSRPETAVINLGGCRK